MGDEELDKHVPGRLAEQPVGTQQLPAQQKASDRSPRVRECAGHGSIESAVCASQMLVPRAKTEGLRYFAAG